MTEKFYRLRSLSLALGNTSVQNSQNSRRFALTLSGENDDHRTKYGSLESGAPGVSRSAPSCCVAGDHILTSSSGEFLRRSLSLNSLVQVDISDLTGDGEAPYVPLSLRQCKKMILTPYTVLLSLIGWRPWFKDSVPRCQVFWKVLNVIYPSVVILLMLCHYVFQILICQGKFNIFEDTKPVPTTPPTPKPTLSHVSNCSVWQCIIGHCVRSPSKSFDGAAETRQCQHIVPTYIVPMLMHMFAYAYGFLYFRIQECEQLYSLMERVFLQAYATPGVQGILIRNSRLYLISASMWLLLQFGTEVLYYYTYNTEILADERDGIRFSYISICLKSVGMILVQCVNVTVVLNYCMQCEMLVFHIKGICLRLHEKNLEIKDAMHEILGVRAFISLLNETMGKMMAFCIVNFAELTVVGGALLLLNENHEPKVITYRTVFPALWFAAMILPLLQAARLTRTGTKLRQISFEMRVFGYQRASQLDLDSFVLFVSGATLRTKLFGVTIRPASIILTFGAALFVILTLMVVGIISFSGYKAI